MTAPDILGKVITAYFNTKAAYASRISFKSYPSNPLSEELAQNGIVVLKELIPADLIQKINQNNQALFDLSNPSDLTYCPDGKALLPAVGVPRERLEQFYFLHINDYHLRFDVYEHIVSRIGPILSSFYKSNYYVRDLYCYRTQPVPEVLGSYLWHTDNYPKGSLKVITYLTDVLSIENGPFGYALKSHTGFKPELGHIGARFREDEVKNKYETVECLGRSGTVIITDNNGVHRANEPTKGHRDVINFTVFPSIFRRSGAHVTGLNPNATTAFLKKYTR
jgi:hypothetical protein